jgi:hypothetical protein
MNATPLIEQLMHEIAKLSPVQQAQLLHLARQLQPEIMFAGTPGEVMLTDLDRYNFAPGALDEMLAIIEEETERIDLDGWQ